MADWTSLMNGLNSAAVSAFGREVSYFPLAGGPAVPVRAILQPGHQGEDAAPGVYAALFLRLADLPQPPHRGDAVMIDGSTYKVFEIEADGQGGVTLALRQQ